MTRSCIYVAIALIAVLSTEYLHGGEMDGEWVSIARIRSGSQQFGEPTTASIKDGKFHTLRDGKLSELRKLSEETDVTPTQYKVKMTGDVKDSGTSFNGIVSISGDTMFTCVHPIPDAKRPTAFTSTKDNGNILIVWMRKKALSHAIADEREFDRAYQFIEKHALNRTMIREDEGTIADGKVAYSFRREATLCKLVRSQNRFTYDVIYAIKQKNWDLQDGKKVGEPRTQDRILVKRYEFGHRKSTGELIGTTAALTSTRADFGASTSTLRMKLDGDRLNVEVETGKYDDYFDRGGKFYPGASVENQVWFTRDGKLICESRQKTFRVNPKSGDKEEVNVTDKVYVETELTKLPLE